MKPTNEPKKPFFQSPIILAVLGGILLIFFCALSILMAVFRTIS